ncbi:MULTISPECIES: glycosyltransferase family 2 protein [Rhodococcus]|uniref:Glycosyltransferase family 2 protein n=1 Tax=Rhodococcus pseudokoreensis TaxID=2811421 RepID=A0A974W1B6_9NOCA|nr:MULTISPECIES: glycosyltransferase family 2 protein [Rhodococcus]MBV6757276.1 glycosyltransferase [Rhodococcus opacus]QSE89459.1 glycosyltransferase family 2 protein [Rhodococcus pseudokoreensis]
MTVSTLVSCSVVICAYTTERWSDLCAAVDSVLTQSVPVLEVLLVIDHSEELFSRAERHFAAESRVTVLRNSESRGLSGARNTGVRASRGDMIAFLDDDARAEPDWYRVSAAHYSDPDVLGVGGFASPAWPADRPVWMPAEFDWVVGCSYVGQPTRIEPVRNFIGCNMSLRRTVFDAVDGFSDGIGRVGKTPVGCEETELCIRIRTHQPTARLLFDPAMKVVHRVSDDRTTFRYFLSRCFHEGVSKALVSDLVGAGDALSSERAYTARVLPRAVVTGITSPRHGGLSRAGAVIAGFTVTAAGYARGLVGLRSKRVTA